MSTSPLVLKNPKGWFAAGAEVEKALTILSDGAFKLFVYLCLHARRDTGVIEITQTELARNLKKGNHTIRNYLHEMEKAGICQSHYQAIPYSRGSIEFSPDFWPYQKPAQEAAQDGVEAYVAEIKKMLQARACVQSSFSTADEILAHKWFAQDIPLERIEQAILLGCIRKYVSWRNNQGQTPISRLHYFEQILDELEKLKADSDYWNYVRSRLDRLEKLWKKSHQLGKDRAPA